QGYHLIFSSTDGGPSAPRCVKERRVDGVIFMGCDISKELILSLNDIPLVLVDNHLDGVNSIAIDNEGGAYKAVEYLIKLGYRKIGFIAERLSDLSFKERFEGYKAALKEYGLEYHADLVAEGLTPPEHGYVAMKKLLKRGTPPAVFAANDSTAAGAIKAIKENGLRVPDDIAVIGFDDGPTALHTVPLLTTVRVFREKMARVAAKRLMELIENPDQPPIQLRLPTELVIRESCGGGQKH
ncbi:MAG: LacI family transcriptional regulator, partial [Thermoplasmata archaeon]